jgi:glycosyltransferase involved in cell wall biosynthesis
MRSKKPLISCLCVSKRPEHLVNAISCFSSQTYPNKELVVVVTEDDTASIKHLKSLSVKGLKYFIGGHSAKMSLGSLRNLSIEKSAGEYFCQWDDDDWYHSQRLEIQLSEALKHNKSGSVLAYWLIYNAVDKSAYLSHPHIWGASILCKRELFTKRLRYPDQATGEDSAFLKSLYTKNCLYPIVMPSLYIYNYHGSNTMSFEHFNYFFTESQKLSNNSSKIISSIVGNKYAHDKASKLLDSESIRKEFDFFKAWKQ